jgi:D-3-phosphoglycerate dehydrogenase
VGLDVFENEPTGGVAEFPDTELASMATCTPHIGASTAQASEATAEEVVDIVRNYRESGKPTNAVNLLDHSESVINMTVRHYNKVGVLAAVLTDLRGAGINVEEMANTIFAGSKAACCVLHLDAAPPQRSSRRSPRKSTSSKSP